MIRKFGLLLTLLLLLNTLSGCAGGSLGGDISGVSANGNTPGNFAAGANQFQDDRYVYVSGFEMYRVSKATGKVSFFCDDPTCTHGTPSCAARQSFYCAQRQNNKYYFRITNGTGFPAICEYGGGDPKGFRRLDEEECDTFRLAGDYLVYTFLSGDPTDESPYGTISIRAKNRSTGEIRTLAEGSIDSSILQVENGFVYYLTYGLEIRRVDLNGQNQALVTDQNAGIFSLHGEYVYFSDIKDHYAFYRVKKDGSEPPEKIAEDVRAANISGNKVYYTTASYGNRFCMMELDGSNQKQLTDFAVSNVNVFEDLDYIVFWDANMKQLYSIQKDGANLKKLEMPDYIPDPNYIYE